MPLPELQEQAAGADAGVQAMLGVIGDSLQPGAIRYSETVHSLAAYVAQVNAELQLGLMDDTITAERAAVILQEIREYQLSLIQWTHEESTAQLRREGILT